MEKADEFHSAIGVDEMRRVMHSAHALVCLSHSEEGFGLPAAEAMASSIPTVLTRIPSFLSLDERQDYALFVDERDSNAAGDRLYELLTDRTLRERIATRGREVAEQFRAEYVGQRLDEFFSRKSC